MLNRVLITGGAGFVGSNLAIGLVRAQPGLQVLVLDNLRRRGSELNLPRLSREGIQFVHGDVRNREDLEACGKFELLIDCSAEPSVNSGYADSPDYLINTNLIGTVNCLEMSRLRDAGFILFSTSRVYPIDDLRALPLEEKASRFEIAHGPAASGASPLGVSETFGGEGARSLYGATKRAAEILVTEYSAAFRMPSLILRCGVIAGPWQMGKTDQGVVSHWVLKHLFGGKLAYIGYGGKGLQVRDILDVRDLMELTSLLLPQLENFSGEIFNVGGGLTRSVSLQELTQLCSVVSGHTIQVSSQPETSDVDVPLYVSDCSKIESQVNWCPRYSVEDTVSSIHDWAQSNRSVLREVIGEL